MLPRITERELAVGRHARVIGSFGIGPEVQPTFFRPFPEAWNWSLNGVSPQVIGLEIEGEGQSFFVGGMETMRMCLVMARAVVRWLRAAIDTNG